MSNPRSASPADADLTTALVALKSQHPSLGISKIHALMLESHPAWIVSEKRTKKLLQSQNLVLSSQPKKLYPSSRVIKDLDVSKYSSQIQVKFFGRDKGKGLVAKEKIEASSHIWREDPFVVASEWEIYDLQYASTACAFCTTPFVDQTALITTCPSSTTEAFCSARFCSRLCASRGMAHTHALLCPAKNPASIPLLKFARENEWLALHALTQLTSRLLLAAQRKDEVDADWEIVRAFAEMGLEERHQDYKAGVEPDRELWSKAHRLFVQAFKEPTSVAGKRKLDRIVKKPLKSEIAGELFSYDAFLRGIGRMSLNLEAHGGLYVLHSHMNHSCTPNISVRHLDTRSALARITMIALRDIEPGEELCITYVNPKKPLRERREALREWGFGLCQCTRCLEEEKTQKPGETISGGMEDLEHELKAGLGLM